MVTVSESIEASEDKDRTGGLAYLAALAQNTPSALNIRRYAELVRERAVQRRLAQVATEIAEKRAQPDSGKDVGQLLDEAETRILEIGETGARHGTGLEEIKPVLARVLERIDFLYHRDNPSDVTGVPTGFTDLDSKTAGLQPGDLIIVAGRPSMGKTALRAEYRRARGAAQPAAGRGVQHGNGCCTARDAHARLDRARRPAQDAHRPAERPGVERPVRGDGAAARRAALHRRDRAR